MEAEVEEVHLVFLAELVTHPQLHHHKEIMEVLEEVLHLTIVVEAVAVLVL